VCVGGAWVVRGCVGGAWVVRGCVGGAWVVRGWCAGAWVVRGWCVGGVVLHTTTQPQRLGGDYIQPRLGSAVCFATGNRLGYALASVTTAGARASATSNGVLVRHPPRFHLPTVLAGWRKLASRNKRSRT
jgi:hypothetical protein